MNARALSLIFLLSLAPVHAHAQGTTVVSWLFNTDGNTEGWTSVNVQAQIVSGGVWVINPNPSDPQLISPLLSRAPSSINYLKYGVRNQGSDTAGRVYYSGPSHGYSQTNSKAFTNPNNGLYNWIVVRLNDIPGWNDGSLTNIDHIRIDPVNAGSGSGALDDVLTDYIFLRNDVTNPSQPTITSVTPGSWTNGSVTACFESNDPADVNPVGPDAYGSGIADFRYRVDPQADQVKLPDSFNQTTGLAAACVTYAPGSLANGANQFHVYCFDKVGRVSVDRQTTLYYDGVNPVNPTISSSSHSCGAWSTDNTIAVSWPGASDAHSGIAGYSWEFSASPSTVPDAAIDGAGTGTTSGALPDGTWYFHVRTIDNAGNSVTAHSCAYPVDTTLPTNPTVSSTSHTPSVGSCDPTVDVQWPGASDATSGVAGYSWLWDTAASTLPDAVMDGTGTTTTSPALADGPHYFHLRTVDNAGNWAGAVHLGPFVISSTGPGMVVNLTSPTHVEGVWSNASTVEFTWEVPGATCGGITGYSYEWSTAPDTEPDGTVETSSAMATLTGVADGCGYFHVRAVDVSQALGPTVHAGPFCIDTGEPTNPSQLASTSHTPSQWSSDDTIDVSWSGASDALSGVGGYSYLWDTSPGTIPDAVVDGTGTMTTSPVLGGGDSHYVHLRTMDNAGNWSSAAIELGPFWIDTSGPGSVTGLGSPSHVVGVWSNDNTIEAEWTAPGGGGSGVAGYSILWNGSASTDPDLTVETTALSTVSPPQTDGQRYVHVRAINGAGVAGPTSHLGAFRIDAKAPTALVATPHGGETWQAEDIETIEFGYIDTGSGVANLELHYSTDGGATFPSPNLIANPLIGTSSFAWTIPHDPSTAAVIRLRVTDVAGNIGEDVSGVFTLREIPTSVSLEVHSFALYQNVPNPFNPTTQIRYDVPNGAARVALRVYDINGRLVRTLVDEHSSTGQNVATWDGSDDRGSRVSSGIYFYRLSSGSFSQTRKMVILK